MISVKKKGRQAKYPQIGRHEIASSAFGFISEYGKFIHSVKETLERLLYSRYCTSDSLDS